MEEVPPPPKLTRAKRTTVDPEPEVQAIPPRPKSRAKKEAPAQAPEPEPVKIKRVRKKPEPGTVPPKEVSFTGARGPVTFTAHKEPGRYANLHSQDRFSHIMRQW